MFLGQGGTGRDSLFSVGLGSKNLPFCVCGGSLGALQCIKSLWTLKDQMSGNLLVWLDHFSLETQITPVEVKKNFNNMVDHFKWRHPTSFDGADDENRQLWGWQSGGDDVESTPAMRLATMIKWTNAFYYCAVYGDDVDNDENLMTFVQVAQQQRAPPSKWWFCRERRGPHICYDNFHRLAYYRHHSVRN